MKGAGGHIRAGALTIPIAADTLEQWAERAEPGERIVYAVGPIELPEHATFVMASALRRQGVVNTHLRRRPEGGGFDFLAVRRAADPGQAQVRHAVEIDESDLDQVVLRAFRRAANNGLVCPTNAELARLCGLPDAAAASYRIRKLITAQLIRVEDGGPSMRRIVTILASGRRTAEGAL